MDANAGLKVCTSLLSPVDELWVLLALPTFRVHELAQFLVVVDDSDELLHLSVVLLDVFVRFLLQ